MIRITRPTILEDEIKRVGEILRSGLLTQGEWVEKFEKKVADYLGVEYAIAVSSGTAGLHLALLATIHEGEEVIVPDFTFPATVNAIIHAGGKPVLVDIDPRTYNIDVNKIKEKITDKTMGIIPVHLFGQSADMNPIMKLVKEHKFLWVIEDAACALGAKYGKKKCGTMGDVGVFSFHPRKSITTGEGGMLVTNNEEIAAEARALRNHGIRNGRFQYAGFNYRMTDFQAAIGYGQMDYLDRFIQARQTAVNLYNGFLSEVEGITVPCITEKNIHTFQSYVIRLNDAFNRDDVIKQLKEKGVETTIGTYAVHTQPFYKFYYGYSEEEYPESYRAFKQTLVLPLYYGTHVGEVIHFLKEALQ